MKNKGFVLQICSGFPWFCLIFLCFPRFPCYLGSPRTQESALCEASYVRSNFNSRGVNSRELFWFFGHSSLSHHAILTKIGAKSSYRPPGAF